MSAPHSLAQFLESARNFVRSAHRFDVAAKAENARTMLGTAHSYVEPTAALEAAFGEAALNIAIFEKDLLCVHGCESAETSRQLALLAIDRLDQALTDARPNRMAAAIGLAWY